ncbi:signal transduction histidine kinase [Anseongella ginsenosidimutans]|uniref:histidine kinase n=1 Tax=Anseongella ginsenosidimutans TaxID=496056 RepID=A0A4R3KR24_9SPHI|nr:ATP-binding protein [Anseongella ginsenosidimutans]QEC52611.1 HAMP domain-containing protein [Anseongella ginsenosidimutans]TCS86533.1 signal transduction histidine kinase [Anseongella ginsenosidimutans]
MGGIKIKYKIAIIYTVLTAAVLCIVSTFIYIVTSIHRKNEFFGRLHSRASIAAEFRFLQSEVDARLFEEISRKHLQALPEEREWVFDADEAGREKLLVLLDSLEIPASFLNSLLENSYAEHESNRTQTVGIRYDHRGKEHLVMVSAFDEAGKGLMTYLFRVLFTGVLVSVAVVYLLGLIYAGSILKPIAQIIQKVNRITASNLHLRLEVHEPPDELADLALTFNRMLDRLETSFDIQHNFISNASHELNNPLTAIVGESEVALSKNRDAEEYRQSLEVISREASRLERITLNLLKLAQTSYNDQGLVVERFRLDELLLEIKKDINENNPGNKVQLDFSNAREEERLYLAGSRSLIKIALTNIAENASKFSANNDVELGLYDKGPEIMVRIWDRGVGIPENELKYIYDPFFRASNVRNIKGFGIGLPLAYKIMSLHGGRIRVESVENEGTVFELYFPLGAAADFR